ncbi:MAG: transposase [Bacteroidia bacterium]|nr:transposase [Bacteroidia bacterium]
MKKGRSKDLVKNRDINLVARFYYWNELKRIRFDDCINNLLNEFYITEQTILLIIKRNENELTRLRNSKTKESDLKKLNKSFNWK